ncbi:TetR/AcrR family transcriptional regulator [Edwardsiella piscicida]|uniref:TetR/AcrR family transcriptional regulator n=2 Tax=Edwardsiella piscicida TaxID=1263550 RepID=A0AAQ3C163_EDWPI|nr:TetR/AcrR family transcriptional regulator [Edwardsiella piscicida]ACY85159.1 putative transcriptional regulator [Edwardsiella tarda EIB202]ARD19419.1 TetR family transcriptional regulator [Edwardsiella piscicida]EKS7780768.1 TetR/AcrR family transcriptional regulator [Edwardsiella piscicida]EKS7784779.1 TetR/AcrR family transcriptional regulator [Edwardsiella piscicida]EKS7792230.1 TetR/AcrR family transcriptional regulator [Edwardsiella piscicida]
MATEHTSCKRAGRGRPKVFDREVALRKALELFWRQGYEATSLADLVEATGAKAPTLYAEFENKEGLFRAVVEYYTACNEDKYDRLLFNVTLPLAETIHNYLSVTANCFTSGDTPSGCFIICASMVQTRCSDKVSQVLKSRQPVQEAMLARFLQLRQAQGELPAHSDAQGLARYLCCVIQGMSVRAREGADCADLQAIVAATMAVWPALCDACRRPEPAGGHAL